MGVKIAVYHQRNGIDDRSKRPRVDIPDIESSEEAVNNEDPLAATEEEWITDESEDNADQQGIEITPETYRSLADIHRCGGELWKEKLKALEVEAGKREELRKSMLIRESI